MIAVILKFVQSVLTSLNIRAQGACSTPRLNMLVMRIFHFSLYDFDTDKDEVCVSD